MDIIKFKIIGNAISIDNITSYNPDDYNESGIYIDNHSKFYLFVSKKDNQIYSIPIYLIDNISEIENKNNSLLTHDLFLKTLAIVSQGEKYKDVDN